MCSYPDPSTGKGQTLEYADTLVLPLARPRYPGPQYKETICGRQFLYNHFRCGSTGKLYITESDLLSQKEAGGRAFSQFIGINSEAYVPDDTRMA